ncbi:MAG: hypothetical protein DRP45_10345 [Candidatus Zixiibacteriota bacterium]|nr:MAG: hypothetical protein DRP45_10345 [candidate division Zixibacteria bacterium]
MKSFSTSDYDDLMLLINILLSNCVLKMNVDIVNKNIEADFHDRDLQVMLNSNPKIRKGQYLDFVYVS